MVTLGSSPLSLAHCGVEIRNFCTCYSLSEPQKFVVMLDDFPAVLSPCNQGQSMEPLLRAVLSALGMRPWR